MFVLLLVWSTIHSVWATFYLQNFKNLSMDEVAKLCKNDTDKVRNDFTYYMEKAKVSEKHWFLYLSVCFKVAPLRKKNWFCCMQTAKMQTSLRIRTLWSAPLLFAERYMW